MREKHCMHGCTGSAERDCQPREKATPAPRTILDASRSATRALVATALLQQHSRESCNTCTLQKIDETDPSFRLGSAGGERVADDIRVT